MYYRLFLIISLWIGVGTLAGRADEALEAPVPVRTVTPTYPPDLKHDKVSGVVSIVCVIDEKGNVTEPKVLKTSHPEFAEPALEAVGRWKFKPAKRGGTVVAIKITIPVQFNAAE